MSYNLVGNSGCKLVIIEANAGLRVQKTSPSLEYNERLVKQMEKQQAFSHAFFKTPEIFASGFNADGLFYFDMNYISGVTLAEHIENMAMTEISELVEKFCSVIPHKITPDSSCNVFFQNKIKSIENNIECSHPAVRRVQRLLSDFDFSFAHTPARIPTHGDLTFENILFYKGQLYLIDFLDSFYDSWIIDIAKIFQDLEIMWSYRHNENVTVNLKLRLITLKKLLTDYIRNMEYGQKLISTLYCVLLLNILRIMPYSKDRVMYDYLVDKLDKISRQEEIFS